MLTEKRKADREAMATDILTMWRAAGFTGERIGPKDVYPGKRCTQLNLEGPRGLCVSPRFNGDSWQADTYVLSWYMSTKATAQLAGIFGSVNTIHRHKATDIAEGFDSLKALITRRNGKPAAAAFVGRAVKPTWKYYFNTEAQRQAKIDETLKSIADRQTRKADEAAARKAFRHTLKVGDVLRSSWGYDQTNVDYYQVVALKGSTQVVTRRIAAVSEGDGWTGRSGPDVGAFLDRYQPETFKVQEGNCIRVASYARAYPMPMQQVGGLKVYETTEWSAYA